MLNATKHYLIALYAHILINIKISMNHKKLKTRSIAKLI